MNAFFNTCLAALLGLAGSACARAAEKVMDERELLEYPDELRQAYASEPFLLLRASAMEKFMPDELPADAEERIGAPVRIYCARNEAESVQVLIVPTGPGLKEVRARVEWDDADGHHTQGWIYPLYEILDWINSGKIKELKES